MTTHTVPVSGTYAAPACVGTRRGLTRGAAALPCASESSLALGFIPSFLLAIWYSKSKC